MKPLFPLSLVPALVLFSALAFTAGSASAAVEFSESEPTFEGLSSATLSDGDSGLEFCHSGKWSKACLAGLLVYRCAQYAAPFTPYGCTMASTTFVDLLELDRIDISFEDSDGKTVRYSLPVIFTHRLARMIEQPKVQADIRALRILLENSARDRTSFSLWSWVLARQGGNFEKALEWLSVLLQDTSPIQIQVEYLRVLHDQKGLSENAVAATDDLMEISTFLSYENLQTQKWREWLRLYPYTKNLEAETTPLIYHFYPMAFLSAKLGRAYSDRLAAFIPFVFNTEYLNQDLDPEMWPLHHPRAEKLDLKLGRIQWKMRDMYGGYAGALWGIGSISTTPGLKSFQERYARAPFQTMRHLFWNMPKGAGHLWALDQPPEWNRARVDRLPPE